MSFKSYFVTIYLKTGLCFVGSIAIYLQLACQEQKLTMRNPFCYGSKAVACQCLAIGKVEGTKEKLAVIIVNKKFATVRAGDSFDGNQIVEITDCSVTLTDKHNNRQTVNLES